MMNKLLKTALPVAGVAAVGAAALLFAVAPGRATKEQKAPFMGRNIAHRGLHTIDKSVPENSLAAFRAAVDHGYGVEFDVHLTADDRLVVFHDDTLERMCGVEGRVTEWTYAELCRLSLSNSDQRIPLLEEVLAVIGGKVPIILEIKRSKRNRETCEHVYHALWRYRGAYCVESFDPFVVRWWKKNAPGVLRGQLSCRKEKLTGTNALSAFALSHLLTNFLCRPQFVAYGICEKKPWTVRLCEKLGAMRVAWTGRSWAAEADHDTVIFEFYRPRIRFHKR